MCTFVVLMAIAGLPKGTVVIVPASKLQGYSQAEIKQAQACARSKGIVPRIDWDK